MPSWRTTVALLVVVGLLLLTNSLWLFPDAGESHYTLERAEISVENETLTYQGVDHRRFHEWNDLEPVGCQRDDEAGERACAFDHYLVANPPVSVPDEKARGSIRPEFVRIQGDYYRRTHERNGSESNRTVTHDVEPVEPETILAESAVNLTGVGEIDRRDYRAELYVAVTGETVTSEDRLERDDFGNVYLQNESYYTVVVTDKTYHDGPEFAKYDGPRRMLSYVGIFFLVWAGQRFYTRPRE